MSEPFLLGWEEWLALPDLGLPAIKAKIDTGARTSALHAFTVESFGPAAKPKVRFGVHPVPGRDDIEVYCIADVVDRREVTSSNGESEQRYVVRTTVTVGGRSWPIEVTLANRESMAYRMLLGRQAIQEDMFVDATASFRQPKLTYRVYKLATRAPETQRPLTIALLTQRPENPSNRRLLRAAEGRGHQTIVIERTRLSLYIAAGEPALYVDGRPLTGVNIVFQPAEAGARPESFPLKADGSFAMKMVLGKYLYYVAGKSDSDTRGEAIVSKLPEAYRKADANRSIEVGSSGGTLSLKF